MQFSHVVTDAETWFTLDLKAHKISREAVSCLMAEWGRGRLWRCKTLHFVLHDDVFSSTSAEERYNRKEQSSGQSLVQKEITQKKKILWFTCLWASHSQGISWETPSLRWNAVTYAPPGCIALPPGLSISCHSDSAPAASVRGPAETEQAAPLGEGFILQGWRMSCFSGCWGASQYHITLGTFRCPPPHPHGNATSSRAWVLTPGPPSTLPRKVFWRHRQELRTFGPTQAISFDGKLRGVLQRWPVWQAVGLASCPQPFRAWPCDCTLVPHEHLFVGWGPPNTRPRHTAFIWFICAFYTTYGIHICNVAMALPSPDDNIAVQTSRHHWCQNTNIIKQSSRYWGHKHHNINPGPNRLNSFL